MRPYYTYLLILGIISGCAVAPLNIPTTGRSLGNNNSELNLGLSPGPYTSATYGLSDHLDIGGSLELQLGLVASIFGKYSFINSENKSSLSLYTSLFSADSVVNSKGIVAGPIYSYRSKKIEPFLSFLYSYIDFEKNDPSYEDNSDLLDIIEDITNENSGGSTQYLDTNIGFNYWISSKTKIYLYAKNLYFLEYSFSEKNFWIFGLGAGFKMTPGNQ